MSRIIECWRCDGSGYIEACYECDLCGGCGTVVAEDEDFDDNLDDFIPEEEICPECGSDDPDLREELNDGNVAWYCKNPWHSVRSV